MLVARIVEALRRGQSGIHASTHVHYRLAPVKWRDRQALRFWREIVRRRPPGNPGRGISSAQASRADTLTAAAQQLAAAQGAIMPFFRYDIGGAALPRRSTAVVQASPPASRSAGAEILVVAPHRPARTAAFPVADFFRLWPVTIQPLRISDLISRSLVDSTVASQWSRPQSSCIQLLVTLLVSVRAPWPRLWYADQVWTR